jgi:hypothetical protein
MIRRKCPKCAHALAIPDHKAGGISSCPECGQKFRVPAAIKQSGPPPRSAHADDADEEPPDEERDDDEGSDQEAEEPRKRKKKKRKKSKGSPINPLHIALIVGCLFVVGMATFILFRLQHGGGGRAKNKLDPEVVLDRLQAAGASVKRDTQSPDQPVVEITLGGEYDPKLLADLKAFPQLRRLSLAGTPTTDLWLEWLEDVNQITWLNISHTKVSSTGIQYLRKMVNLEELNLEQTLVEDHGLMELKGCKKLKHIYLDGTLASGLPLKAEIPDLVIHK